MNEEVIQQLCQRYTIKNYHITDGIVNVEGNVNLAGIGLEKIPLQFGTVTGYFACNHNKLTSLNGSPTKVGQHFYCHYNQLTSLENGPMEVGGSYDCNHNQFVTLKGSPKVVQNFDCSHNQILSLQEGPQKVLQTYSFHHNQIKSFQGLGMSSRINCADNPVEEIWNLFQRNSKFLEIFEIYNFFQSGVIDADLVEEIAEHLNITLLKKWSQEISQYVIV